MVPVTPYNFDFSKITLEKNSGEIMTVPDQGLSIEELWRRSAAGTLPQIAKDPVWDENPALENAIKPDFDLTDLDATNELIEALTARYESEKAFQEESKKFSESVPPAQPGE